MEHPKIKNKKFKKQIEYIFMIFQYHSHNINNLIVSKYILLCEVSLSLQFKSDKFFEI